MDGKIYKQTYHLDDSDSASSEEIEYIPGAPDMTEEEIERIIAAYEATRKPKTRLQVAVYDDDDTNEEPEDENEEPYVKTIRYKTTYRTSPEQQSSSEVSYDEDTNEEPNIRTFTYKTTYRTSPEQQASPEASYDEDRNEISEDTNEEPESKEIKYKTTYKITKEDISSQYEPFVDDDNDEDWEPEVRKPKGRFKSLFNPSKEKRPFSEVLDIDRRDVPKAVTKRKKKTNRASVVGFQPFTGAQYIEAPVPNNSQKLKQTYKERWEADPSLKGWLQPVLDDPMYAFCKYCRCKLVAHKKTLKDHSTAKKHQRSTYEVTGIWTGSNPKPSDLEYQACETRDKISQEAETSPILNMLVVNDPLLPIS